MGGRIIKRGANTYQLEYSNGFDINGKRIRKYKTIHGTKTQAQKELAHFIADCDEGRFTKDSPTTVSDLAKSYLENVSARYKKATSQRSDKGSCKNWIIPYLGNAKLSKIKKYDVQLWVNTMEDKGQSPKSIRNHFSIFRAILDYGIDLDLIEDNPCTNVRLPKKDRKEARSYTKEEVAVILDGLDHVESKDYRFKCFILLALFGGFRRGEILGFNWDDLNGNEITINRTRYGDSADTIWEDTPKTDKSARTIALPEFIVKELLTYKTLQLEEKLRCGKDYFGSPAMFRNETGQPLRGSRVFKWFSNFCKANDIPAYGLHALRHTHASMLASLGADKVQVSNRLGHSQLSTTLNIYTHLFESADETLANQLEDYRQSIKSK